MRPIPRCAAGMLLVAVLGCGGAGPPTLVPAEGTITINGQPLPHAAVTFTPTAAGLGSDAIATGLSDAQGKFTLTTAGKPGAAAGEHKVTVGEGPEPEELRDESKQGAQQAYQAKLKHRPIPPMYRSPAQTPLTVAVKADQKEYKVELKR